MTPKEKMNDLKATFQKCLESPEPFSDDDEKESCRRMVEALPKDLVVHAANTSYAFWFLSNLPESAPSEEVQVAMAMREARRHLSYMAGDYNKALNNLVEAMEYRKVRFVCRDGRLYMRSSSLTMFFSNPSHIMTGEEAGSFTNMF